ncbi:YitT family protein [Sporosarcina aquimarina]|uniref:YitT family protein n=1 Tax=Sporosarcina aquimarina TaxID=114975 RepID=A0ABU4FZY3_9BACL|nr:YitT family protein [Sporosarcina aquimarina]MDW0110289.1 YitT family protein [Sporosarcina aquimarina]
MGIVQRVWVLLVGTLLLAIGLNGFLVPHGLMEGGALGISLIVHYVMGTKVGLTFLLISIPIFLLAWLTHRPFFYNGIHGMLISAIVIDMMAPLREIAFQLHIAPLTSAAIGGLLIGIGTGIMMSYGISIGGTDLLAQLVAKGLKTNSGLIILLFDIMIVMIGSSLITEVSLLLSLVTVLCVGLAISVIVFRKTTIQSKRVLQ